MLNYKLNLIKTKITDFIKNKKASDDKNTGTAMSMIFAVVIGLLLITIQVKKGEIYEKFKENFYIS